MKLIILDYLRRRWMVLTALFIGYFVLEEMSVSGGGESLDTSTNPSDLIQSIHQMMYQTTIFPLIMFLGFFMITDLKTGYTRVLNILPMTAKKTGHSLWLAYVALPSVMLAILSATAIATFSAGTHWAIPWSNYLTNWILTALALGGTFGGLTFASVRSDNLFQLVRTILLNMLPMFSLFGWLIFQIGAEGTLTLPQSIFIFSALMFLSVAGWFRAGQTVQRRANFRINMPPACQGKTVEHKTPDGIGGLPFFVQKVFVQTIIFGFGMLIWLFFATFFLFPFHGLNRVDTISNVFNGGSVPFFFILMLPIASTVFQLRLLRTMPMTSSTLAATIVFLPAGSTMFIGLIATALSALYAGETVIPHTLNIFLMLGIKVTMITYVVIWRGLDTVTYCLGFFLMIGGSLTTLAMTLIFHLHGKSPELPWLVSLIIFLISVALFLALTYRLLTKSSCAYRPRTMPANAWNMMKR